MKIPWGERSQLPKAPCALLPLTVTFRYLKHSQHRSIAISFNRANKTRSLRHDNNQLCRSASVHRNSYFHVNRFPSIRSKQLIMLARQSTGRILQFYLYHADGMAERRETSCDESFDIFLIT